MKFETPQVNIYVGNLEISRKFYERMGFNVNFTAKIGGKPVHHEMMLDGFTNKSQGSPLCKRGEESRQV